MSRELPQVRLGIVGVGAIGRRHLQLASLESRCQVVALADPAPEVAAIAKEAGIPHRTSHRAMLDSAQLDGVIVAAPTQLHAPIGLDLARRDLPMLIEKPFTDTLAAGLELASAAAASRVPICVGHHRRFDPAVAAARELLAAGRIGRLLGVSGIWAARKPNAYYDVEWRREVGGGPVLINMIHDIDMLRHCCGEVDSVYAELTPSDRGFPVEAGGAILLRFAGGALATISFSDGSPSPWGWERATADNPIIPPSGENCFRFFGSSGSFEFPQIRLWRNEPGAEPCWSREIRSEGHPIGPRAALAEQLRNFCNVVRGRDAPVVGPEDALATLAVALAVHESAVGGSPVEPAFRMTP